MSVDHSLAPSPVVARQTIERTIVMWDGTELFYRAWLPDRPAQKALFLFHRGHEHSGRFCDVVEELGLDDTAAFAWDARGHGRSPGERGAAPSLSVIVKDIDFFVQTLARQHDIPLSGVLALGHSVGAVAVAAWVHDYAPPIRAMVLISPALRVKLYVPLAIPALRLLQLARGRGRSFVKSYVRSTMLTHDADQARRYDEDPLIARSIAVNVLLDLHDTSNRLIEDAGAIQLPTLILAAGKSDWVVRLDAQQRFFDRLGAPIKQMQVFDGMHHDILHEVDRRKVTGAIRGFIGEMFERPPAAAPLVDADRAGHTRREYDRLCQPLPALSLKRWTLATQWLVLRTVGRLCDGIRIGWNTGFDSGQSLDYVYENRPRGRLLVGAWGDRIYLNSPGWRGIRQRRENLQKLLLRAIAQIQQSGKPVRIMDVAAGCGRYVLEAVASLPPGTVESILLRDNTPANLQAARKLADQFHLRNVDFVQADAFDEASLASTNPSPNIVIVSGLYELFPDNAKVSTSLRGIARAMRNGGLLLYTGQPWHPQLELIARVLINREGKPWIMRRRTQQELDDLARAAGFEKTEMEIDNEGIFTVSLARIGALR
jgi:alpha-beta hydrolase superfamily lysophospholipase/ubiquinone/menaquinone biosynthesis C-methylase UbiE